MMSQMYSEQITGLTITMTPSVSTSVPVEVYFVELKQDEGGRFVATVPALPGVVTDGATEDEALDNAREAIDAMLESLGTKKAFMLFTSE